MSVLLISSDCSQDISMIPRGGDTSAILICVNDRENTRKAETRCDNEKLKLDLQPPTVRCSVTSVLHPVKAFLPSRPCAHPTHAVPVALSGKNEEEKKTQNNGERKKNSDGTTCNKVTGWIRNIWKTWPQAGKRPADTRRQPCGSGGGDVWWAPSSRPREA